MSTSDQSPTPMTLTQQMATNLNALNRKMNDLTKSVEDLSIGDDIRQGFAQQIAGIQEQIQQEIAKATYHRPNNPRTRKIDPFDGKKQTLRSFLTAIELQMEDENVVTDYDKVKYVGRYLKDDPWEWFEPIARERNRPRDEWSERAYRILNNYDAMVTAMKQVFGEMDEQRIAAQKMTKLRQVDSVRKYITEFQKIASSLKWHENALIDKFIEGLKISVREKLIYYSDEPQGLEELQERAQRIDREILNKQEWKYERTYHYGERNNYFAGKNEAKRDRDGDTQMIGAKVDLDEARKDRLCFRCGKKGHQARTCQYKEQEWKPKGRRMTARMVRFERMPIIPEGDKSTQSDDVENGRNDLGKEQPAVLATFEGPGSEDFSTESSEQADEPEEPNSEEEKTTKWRQQRIVQWHENMQSIKREELNQLRSKLRRDNTGLGLGINGFKMIKTREGNTSVTPKQRDEDDSLEGPSRGNSPAPGIQGKANPSNSTTAGEFDVSEETRANFSMIPTKEMKTKCQDEGGEILTSRKMEVFQERCPQMNVSIKIGKHRTKAVIDSGANMNYANQKWFKRINVRTTNIGPGEIRAYDGKLIKDDIHEAEITFGIGKKKHTEKFFVLKETGPDKIVLGMPWLRHYNPIINWDRRSMELKSKGDGKKSVNEKEPFDLRSNVLRTKDAVVLAAQIRPMDIGKETAGKGGYDRWNPNNQWSPSNRPSPHSTLRKNEGAATPRVMTTSESHLLTRRQWGGSNLGFLPCHLAVDDEEL